MSAMEEPYRDLLAGKLADLLEGYRGDELPEALWQTALTMIDGATERTRSWRWWRSYPQGELDRLRDRLAEAMKLARFAADLQDAENRAEWDAGALARDLASEAALAGRRAQTAPATRARVEKRAAAAARSKVNGS